MAPGIGFYRKRDNKKRNKKEDREYLPACFGIMSSEEVFLKPPINEKYIGIIWEQNSLSYGVNSNDLKELKISSF